MQRARHRREPGCTRAQTVDANLHIIRHSALTDSTAGNRVVVISHPDTPFAHPYAAGSNENMFYSTFCLLAAPADTFYMYARPSLFFALQQMIPSRPHD
jgi:hypothetical protein